MKTVNYKYANKVYTMYQRNEIWRSLQSDYDVLLITSRAIAHVNAIYGLNEEQIVKSDEESIEKYLGELEIIIRRIYNLPYLFNLDQEQKEDIVDTYRELEEKFVEIQQKRSAW